MPVDFDNLPDDIENYPFVVWKPEYRNGEEVKPPFKPVSPPEYASSIDKTTWSDFDTCQEFLQSHTEYGLGIILGASIDGTNLIGIDMDNIDKIAPEYRAESERWRRDILRSLDTYTEVSPSGKGLHILGKGRLPNSATEYNALKIRYGIEIYSAKRYLTMTGRRVETKPREFRDVQAPLDLLVDIIEKATGTICGEDFDAADIDDTCGRLLDLTDEQVLTIAATKGEAFAKQEHANPAPAGRWSDINFRVIGDLDKVSGVPEQILRICWNLPYVTQSGPAGNGETRHHKLERTFASVLRKVRADNKRRAEFLEVGKRAAEVVLRDFAAARLALLDQARVATEREQEKLAAAFDPVDNGDISDKVMQTMQYIASDIDPRMLFEYQAPEFLENLITLNVQGMKVPFRKFAVVSTLATFSGILGRKFKTEDGISAAIMMVLGAASGGGKGEAFRFWQRQIDNARQSLTNSRNRFFTGIAASAPALHDIMQTGAKVWMLEECSMQLSMLYNTDMHSVGVRDKINEAFDASDHSRVMSPPASIAAQNRGSKEIRNGTISAMWSTTVDAMKPLLKAHGLTTGVGSRALFCIHEAEAGETRDDPILRRLPGSWNEWLVELLTSIEEVDDLYEQGNIQAAGEKIVYVPYATGAAALKRSVEKKIDKLRNAVARRGSTLPGYYVIFVRTAMLAAKIALVSAVVRNWKDPVITREDYAWGLGYVLRVFGELVTSLDQGRFDVELSQTHKVALAVFERLLVLAKKKGDTFVKKEALMRDLRRNSELMRLSNSMRMDIRRIINDALASLDDMDIVHGVQAISDDGTRAPYVYYCGESDYWQTREL